LLGVTLLARNARVLLLERPTRARVIEPLRAAVGPFYEREIAAYMIRMTRRAIRSPRTRMEAAVLLAEPTDLAMTRDAARRHAFLPAAVTLGAVEWTVERRMRG
jgi:hypothetical protein